MKHKIETLINIYKQRVENSNSDESLKEILSDLETVINEPEEKSARFDFRCTETQKYMINQASIYGGYNSVSSFALSILLEKSVDIIKDYETILKSKKDKEIFFKALTNPPEMTEGLLKAWKSLDENNNTKRNE